jgi:nicotinamide mononucleotide transporter
MSAFEIVGAVFSLLSVWYSTRQNVLVWPTGMVGVAAYAVVFFEARLYADMLLQLFYFAVSVRGWYLWLHGGDHHDRLPVTRLTQRQLLLLLPLAAAGILGLGFAFATWTNADLPWLDATASGLSVGGQLLLMRKKLQTWHVWILVNILSVGIYLYKALYLTTGLYFVFLVLAIIGLVQWQKALRDTPQMPG